MLIGNYNYNCGTLTGIEEVECLHYESKDNLNYILGVTLWFMFFILLGYWVIVKIFKVLWSIMFR